MLDEANAHRTHKEHTIGVTRRQDRITRYKTLGEVTIILLLTTYMFASGVNCQLDVDV